MIPVALSCGVLVVNRSVRFRSPLRKDVTVHDAGSPPNVDRLVEHCMNELRNVSERSGVGERGLDAKCAIVVDLDNVDHAAANYVASPPAPQRGGPLNYDSFVQRVCNLYGRRFGSRP